jgi:toxin FitB
LKTRLAPLVHSLPSPIEFMFPLVDTNIVSELMRRDPHPVVLTWATRQTSFFLSTITLEELIFGLARKNLHLKRQWLDEFIEAHCEVIPVTPAIAIQAGQLRGTLAARGIVRHSVDMLIAATAHVSRTTLVTRDLSDFTHCGIEVFDPFTGFSA